jgi:pilus assembly protein CpaC
MRKTGILCLLCLLCLAAPSVWAADSGLPSEIELSVGDSRILSVDLKRAALGDGKIVSLSSPEKGQLLLLGESAGATTAQLWLRDGRLHRLHILVRPQDLQDRLQQVQRLLDGIATITSRVVGERIVLEGMGASESERSRAAGIAALFPGVVLDLVGQFGWEAMLQFDVRIVEIRRDQVQQLGLHWNSDSAGPELSLQWDTKTGQTSSSVSLSANLGSRIDLLQQQGLAQTVAQPTLSCRSGGVARFVSGGEVPIPVVDGLGGTQVQYKEYGVILEVRPRAESAGGIYADVDIELSQIDTSVRVQSFPGFIKRRSSTAINAQPGETIAVAGLIARERNRDRQGIPGLGNLPMAGRLFATRHQQLRQTELLVLITPRRMDSGIVDAAPGATSQSSMVDRAIQMSAPAGDKR